MADGHSATRPRLMIRPMSTIAVGMGQFASQVGQGADGRTDGVGIPGSRSLDLYGAKGGIVGNLAHVGVDLFDEVIGQLEYFVCEQCQGKHKVRIIVDVDGVDVRVGCDEQER